MASFQAQTSVGIIAQISILLVSVVTTAPLEPFQVIPGEVSYSLAASPKKLSLRILYRSDESVIGKGRG